MFIGSKQHRSQSDVMRLRRLTVFKFLLFVAAMVIVVPQAAKLLTDLGQGSANESEKLPREKVADDRIESKKMAENDLPELSHKTSISKNSDKIDWHDYDKIAIEQRRKGNGEHGAPLILTQVNNARKEELFKMNGFNAYLSDIISIDRAVKDLRHTQCHTKTYLSHLPTVSVIIPFHNEHWSILLRSIHSIINRSPPQLIREIILVDDYSDRVNLREQLDDHLAINYDGKVTVIRQRQREGLIRTRLTGARAATGDVLLFLDSHIEAGINWLPPLLEPIAEDYRTVTCPFIDVIDKDNFGMTPQDEGARGAFDWQLFYKRLPLLPEALQHPTEPFESPVMAGGLFAISAKWFWELGGYDQGLEIWGGEQYELSFKLWMCGGRMVDTPCSRVGHIYRKFNPFGAVGKGDYVTRNHRRVVEVWMDEYKSHVFVHIPRMKTIDPGDLTEQKALRAKLQCKSFDWFMKEVAFDLTKRYPPRPPSNTASGEIRNMAADLCIDTKFKPAMESFGLEPCSSDNRKVGGEQQMELTWRRDIRPVNRQVCFDTSEKVQKAPLILYACHEQQGNQWWKYNVDTRQLFHPSSKQCLDADVERRQLFMHPCSTNSPSQKWVWGHVNKTLARQTWGEE